MSTHNQSERPINPLSEAAKEAAQKTSDAAKNVNDVVEDVTDATKDAARSVTATAKDMYQSAALKAEESLETSKDYVRRNPVPVVLGAVAFGIALGYLVVMARRKPTFGERYAEEPLSAVREAIIGALAPVTQRVHQGYDLARDGAGKAMDRVHNLRSRRNHNSISDQIGRIGNNLKFW